MTPLPFLQPIIEDVSRLVTFAVQNATNPEFAEAANELEQAIENRETPPRPLLIALVGGTGVGKSQLFNALIGKPDASPTSSTTRCKTQHVIIACKDTETAALPFACDTETLVPWNGPQGVALIDTPDVDGALPENRDKTTEVLRSCDLIVYVTSPAKYASDAVLQVVREWAKPKRWFFVLNQRDKVSGDAKDLLADFDRKLNELDFRPDGDCRFSSDATRPGDWEFTRLRDTLFSERSADSIRMLAQDAVLARIQRACKTKYAIAARGIATRFDEAAGKLTMDVVREMRSAIGVSRLGEMLTPMLRARAWVALQSSVGWPLALPVMVRARIAALGVAYQAWRIGGGGLSIWKLWGFARSLYRAWLGEMALESLLSPIEGRLRASLANVRQDVQRRFEDEKLRQATPEVTPPSWAEYFSEIGNSATPLIRPFLRLAIGVATKLQSSSVTRMMAPLVTSAVEERASHIAKLGRHRIWLFFLQILPLAVLGHAAWRVGRTWWESHWLPGAFFTHALAFCLLALLPGTIALGWLIAARLRDKSAIQTVLDENAGNLPAVGDVRLLREASEGLRKFASVLENTVERVHQLRCANEQHLKAANLGVTSLRKGA